MYSNALLTLALLNAEGNNFMGLCSFYLSVPTKTLKTIVIVMKKPFKDALQLSHSQENQHLTFTSQLQPTYSTKPRKSFY